METWKCFLITLHSALEKLKSWREKINAGDKCEGFEWEDDVNIHELIQDFIVTSTGVA